MKREKASVTWEKASIGSGLLPDPVEFRVYCIVVTFEISFV